MHFSKLALALPFTRGATALSRRADNNTAQVPVSGSYIIEYAPVSHHLGLIKLSEICDYQADRMSLQGSSE